MDGSRRFWEGRTVADVTHETCRGLRRARGRSAGTVRRELRRAPGCNQPCPPRRAAYPRVAVHLPDRPEAKDRWLTRKEAAALLRAARQEPSVRLHLPLFILIGLYTGQRKEALLSLRWAQVDLDGGRIDFNPPGRRQTNKRRPLVPIAPRLLPHLRRARRRGTELGFVIHGDGDRLGDVKRSFAGSLSPGRAGGRVAPHAPAHGRDVADAGGRPSGRPRASSDDRGHAGRGSTATTTPTSSGTRRGPSRDRPRNVRATPSISPGFDPSARKSLAQQHFEDRDEFSEGKGHTFESCRVRQISQALSWLSPPLRKSPATS